MGNKIKQEFEARMKNLKQEYETRSKNTVRTNVGEVTKLRNQVQYVSAIASGEKQSVAKHLDELNYCKMEMERKDQLNKRMEIELNNVRNSYLSLKLKIEVFHLKLSNQAKIIENQKAIIAKFKEEKVRLTGGRYIYILLNITCRI